MDGNGKRKGELAKRGILGKELRAFAMAQELGDARYGIVVHRRIAKDIGAVLTYAGVKPTYKAVKSLIFLLYDQAEAMKCSEEHWLAKGEDKEYETRAYTNRHGVRLCQLSATEADLPASGLLTTRLLLVFRDYIGSGANCYSSSGAC